MSEHACRAESVIVYIVKPGSILCIAQEEPLRRQLNTRGICV